MLLFHITDWRKYKVQVQHMYNTCTSLEKLCHFVISVNSKLCRFYCCLYFQKWLYKKGEKISIKIWACVTYKYTCTYYKSTVWHTTCLYIYNIAVYLLKYNIDSLLVMLKVFCSHFFQTLLVNMIQQVNNICNLVTWRIQLLSSELNWTHFLPLVRTNQ